MIINEYPNIDYHLIEDILKEQVTNGRRKKVKYYSKSINCIDTETSVNNGIGIIVFWSITLNNIYTIYGRKVENLIEVLCNITKAQNVIFYIHNLSYDYMFLRNHLFNTFGTFKESLATKPHKYCYMIFENGAGSLELRDSYILTGKSLEKFAKDMKVEAQKLKGQWNYRKHRTPYTPLSNKEINYGIYDTISLCQSLIKLFENYNVNIGIVPLTKTGFVRKNGLKYMRKYNKNWNIKGFKESALTFEQYKILLEVYHGAFCHSNRFYIGTKISDVDSFDFTSSYPSVMCYNKFPMGKFNECKTTLEEILKTRENIAYFGYCYVKNMRIKRDCVMPSISQHKCKVLINGLIDNGRVLSADDICFPFSDPDLQIFSEIYDYDFVEVSNVYFTVKDYLPDFMLNLINDYFYKKSTLKGVDDVNYMLAKNDFNSLYGMCVQKIVQNIIEENLENGEWKNDDKMKMDIGEAENELNKFYKKYNKFLPYQWGVWVTSYAMENLFELGKCCGEWIYSDTDSIKGYDWDFEKVEEYNDKIKKLSNDLGRGKIEYKGREFVLGVAEHDEQYKIFKTLGAKRYADIDEKGALNITVSGVPKVAVKQLKNNIDNFGKGFIFCFSTELKTKNLYKIHGRFKKIHEINIEKTRAEYITNNGIHYIKDENNNVIEYGSFIILHPVSYILDSVPIFDKETGLPFNIDY